ncbi:hypothetical protein [Pseudomonas sp. LB3P38]|uniref:hypothetical protein n=1 Tax=Pseudomonas lyxosi TaxID=3398358 RepID=UPI0039EFA51C
MRGTLPLAPSDFIGVPQLPRATVPISAGTDPNGGYNTGDGLLRFALFAGINVTFGK